MQNPIKGLAAWSRSVYERINQRLGGIPEILRDSIERFNQARGAEAAASMAYYALFSLFPLLLSLVAIGSFFLESERIQLEVMRWVRLVIPVSQGLIVSNIEQVLKERTSIGVIGAIGLLWSASASLVILFRNINRAWVQAKPYNTLVGRLISIGIISGLGIILILSLLSTAVFNLIPFLGELFGEEGVIYQSPLWVFISRILPSLIMLVFFMLLYRIVPNTRVRWVEAFWGALVATTAWQVATSLFTFFIRSGLAQYRLVYGSLGAMISLLFWIYLNSFIVIFCAHLTAGIAQHRRKETARVFTPET